MPLQIGDILIADPQLAKEILYDMRQAENAQRAAAEEAAAVTTRPASAGGAEAPPTGGHMVGLRTPGTGRLGRAHDLRQETLMRSVLMPGNAARSGSPFLPNPFNKSEKFHLRFRSHPTLHYPPKYLSRILL